MTSQRADTNLPQNPAAEIDDAEQRRKRLLAFLRSKDPVWKDEDHPELAGGSAAWVRALRQENEARMSCFEEE